MAICKMCGWNNPEGANLCKKCSAALSHDVFISYSRKDYVDDKGDVLAHNILTKIKVGSFLYMRTFFFLFLTSLFNCIYAQDVMRIHYKNGGYSDVPLEDIDSLTFVKKGDASTQKDDDYLIGSWLWGNPEAGYYELLTFNENHTYTGYDNYFTYGFDTITYGLYSYYGTMLTLQSNGFGYQRRYNWFVTTLTDNALGVITKMGTFTYYKLQSMVIKMKVGESIQYGEDENIVFADGVIVNLSDSTLYGASQGVTYILKHAISSNIIGAYKVIVE